MSPEPAAPTGVRRLPWWIIAAVATLAFGAAVFLVLPGLNRDSIQSTALPSATASASSAPSPVPSLVADPAPALRWSTEIFPDRDAVLNDLLEVGDRLVVAGATARGDVWDAQENVSTYAAAWYSDDGGATWNEAAMDVPGSSARGFPWAINRIDESNGVLLATARVEDRDPWITKLWVSLDLGQTWLITPSPVAYIDGVWGSQSGFLIRGYRIRGRSSDPQIWESSDGVRWTEVHDLLPPQLLLGDIADRGNVRVIALRNDFDNLDARERARVWVERDGAEGREVRLHVASAGVFGVSISPGGFVATGYTGEFRDQFQPAIWHSPDGLTWQKISVPLQRDTPVYGSVANGLGIVAVGHFSPPFWGPGEFPEAQYVWFSSGGEYRYREQVVGIQLSGLIARDDSFVGVGDCRYSSQCVPAIVYGHPAQAPAPSSPSPAPVALPTQPPIGSGTPRPCATGSLEGRLVRTSQGDFAIRSDDGSRRIVVWPDAYVGAETANGFALFSGEIQLLAFEGDYVVLGGEARGDDAWLACRAVQVLESRSGP